MTSRRSILKGVGGLALGGALSPLGAGFAHAGTDRKLIFVLLRGGLDALHAVPPYADANYRRARPSLAIAPPGQDGGAIDLNGYFGLHPKLAPLAQLYRDRQLAIIPAATTAYRERSHFDGQNVLENGTGRPHGARDGWLNRALAEIGRPDGARIGLSVGHGLPLAMQGPVPVRSWAPTRLPTAGEGMLDRLSMAYQDDPLLRQALEAARRPVAGGAMETAMPRGGGRRFVGLAEAAAKMMAAQDGPSVGYLEAGGWDTHVAQARRLDRLLGHLGQGLGALRDGLSPVWDRTVIVMVSEFGRTVAENGSGGTDHGVGGVAFVMGGAVKGGRIVGRWPGLEPGALYQERDVAPANDYRAVFKAVLGSHLGIPEPRLAARVFPESAAIRPMGGLIA